MQAQTPQGALFGLIRRAFAEAEADGFSGTDEASLLERAGVEVAVVAGRRGISRLRSRGILSWRSFIWGWDRIYAVSSLQFILDKKKLYPRSFARRQRR